MNTIHRGLLPALLAAALVLAAGASFAAEETKPAPKKGFTFRLDPLVLEILDTRVDTNSSKFGEYRDVSKGFFLPYLGIHGESADGEREVALRAQNVSRRDARYTLDYGAAGRYHFLLDYNKILHRFGNDGHMLWTRTGDGVYEIADPIQGAIQSRLEQQFAANRNGITFSFLNGLLAPYLATANPVDLGLVRDRTLAQLDVGGPAGFAWGLQVTHENRRGNRPYGASFGFSNATEIPEPIDYDTSAADLGGEWNGKSGGLRFGYRYARFENHVSTMIWDNPFRLTSATDPNAYTAPGSSSINGSARGFADLAPDNDASSLYLDGRTHFGGGWWANGSAGYSMMKQNDPLLPYTLNSAIVGIAENGSTFDPTNPANLPVRKADTEVRVANVSAQTGTRFGAGAKQPFSLVFRYRYYDYDDRSPRVEFPGYVRFQSVWEAIGRVTVPFSYRKQNVGAELGWDLAHATRLGLSFERESWDRDFREVKKTDEDIVRLTFDTHPVEKFNLRARYEHGDRAIGAYNTAAAEFSFVDPEVPTNLPDLRKYDEAARVYNSYNVEAQILASEAWNLTLAVTGRKDDYDKSRFGLQDDDVRQYNAELGYTPGEKLNFYLFGNRIDRTTRQQARQSGATPSTNPLDNWSAAFDEVNDNWGLGLTAKLAARWSTDVSMQWTKSDGKADLFSPPGGAPDVAVGFDNYEDYKLFMGGAQLNYRITPAASAGLFYRYEDYTIDSFIRQGLLNYLPGALLLNPNNGDYKAHLFGLNVKLSF
jgi:MtrB/PioB family decaheme-associated outer membrane protein